MNSIKKSCWAGWVVRLAICLIFSVPCMAQELSSKLSSKELFEKNILLKIKQSRLKGRDLKEMGYESDHGTADVDYDGFIYTLDFRNGSEVAFEDLKVECRFFYTEESRSGKSEQKYYEDSLEMSLKPMGRYTFETQPFVLVSWDLRSGYYFGDGTTSNMDADADGLWVRVVYTTPDGKKLQRDFCKPESLSTRAKWVEAPKSTK